MSEPSSEQPTRLGSKVHALRLYAHADFEFTLTEPRRKMTMEWFEEMTEGMEYSDVDSVDIIRAMRDEGY